MKTKLQQHLATIAPQIEITTHWTPDTLHPSEILKIDPTARPSDWQAWQSEIKVRAISGGKLYTASAYLCGTWEKRRAKPWNVNPDISGYEPDMTAEALWALSLSLPHQDKSTAGINPQIAAALEAITNLQTA